MRFKQVRTYATDPADDDPNTTDPFGVTPTDGQVVVRLPSSFFFYFNDTDSVATMTCSWEVWVQDETQTTRWVRVATGTGLDRRIQISVEPHEGLANPRRDDAATFIRLTRTGGGSLSGAERLTTHVYALR